MQADIFSPLIEKANELAAEWHAGTYRKGRWRSPSFSLPNGDAPGIPVISHVTMVGNMVQRAGWNDTTVAAALLHDILEDPNQLGQRMSFDELSDRIGPSIAELVREVSEVKTDRNGNRHEWKTRKIGYVEGLRRHSIEAAAISLADKIHNLWSFNEMLEKGVNIFEAAPGRRSFGAGPEPQRWFYSAVYEATLHHVDSRLVPMRLRFVEELERFTRATQEMI